jgi:methylenetetrahydrofolate reductase (NADPH)
LRTFGQALQSRGLALSAEVPAQGRERLQQWLDAAERLRDRVDGIQFDGLADAGRPVSPIALSRILMRQGLDPVPRIDCRDRNRIALVSDLLGLRAIGVGSVLLARGQTATGGGLDDPKPVFDTTRRDLIAMADDLNQDEPAWPTGGLTIGTPARLAVERNSPEDAIWPDPGAGVRFLQTTPCLDLGLLDRFMEQLVGQKITWQCSVIVTLPVLPSAAAARELARGRDDVLIPDEVIAELERAPDPRDRGIAICAELMARMADIPGVSGFNLLTLGTVDSVLLAIEKSGCLKCA